MNGPEYTYNRRIESHDRQICWIGAACVGLFVALVISKVEILRLESRIAALDLPAETADDRKEAP